MFGGSYVASNKCNINVKLNLTGILCIRYHIHLHYDSYILSNSSPLILQSLIYNNYACTVDSLKISLAIYIVSYMYIRS